MNARRKILDNRFVRSIERQAPRVRLHSTMTRLARSGLGLLLATLVVGPLAGITSANAIEDGLGESVVTEDEWSDSVEELSQSEDTAAADEDEESADSTSPKPAPADEVAPNPETDVSSFAAGVSPGTPFSWGYNRHGQLGVGMNYDPSEWHRPVPAPILTLNSSSDPVIALEAGNYFSMALTKTGKVYMWGDGDTGQMGNGTSGAGAGSSTPIRVTSLPASDPVVKISAGRWHAMALTESGAVYAWGESHHGQVGNGVGNAYVKYPVKISFTERVIAIGAGSYDSMAVGESGSVYAWGGTANLNKVPESRNTPEAMVAVLSSDRGKYSLSKTGFVYEWTTATTWTARKMTDIPGKVKEISGKSYFVFALNDSGNAYGWGSNNDGQLGTGSYAGAVIPTRVLINEPIAHVSGNAASRAHSLAVAESGKVYSWGANISGELGLGSFDPQTVNTPHLVPGAGSDNGAVAAGGLHSLAGGGDNPPPAVEEYGSISGLAWEDTNNNGVKDVGEPSLRGVETTLYRGGSVIATTTTDSNGSYTFAKVLAGSGYTIKFTPPTSMATGWRFTAQSSVCPATDRSCADSTGTTPVLTVVANQTLRPVNAGIVPAPKGYGKISGLAWEDTNSNGVKDPGEPIIPGVSVVLYQGTTFFGRTTTDALGNYTFANLPAGDNYTVGFDAPSSMATGWSYTIQSKVCPAVNMSCADSSGNTPDLIVTANQTLSPVNVGIIPAATQVPKGYGSIAGLVWEDINQDGVRNAGEAMIKDVEVTLYKGSAVVAITSTDVAGNYKFNNVLADSGYTIKFTPPSTMPTGWRFTLQSLVCPMIDRSCADANGVTPAFTVAANKTTSPINAGIVPAKDAEITVTKLSKDGKDTVEVDPGDETPVDVVVTNSGGQPLMYITLTDVTDEGPQVAWEKCSVKFVPFGNIMSLEGTILQPGQSVTCEGKVPALKSGELHQDTITALGYKENDFIKGISDDATFKAQAKKVDFDLFIRKLGEANTGTVVEMAGSEWALYPNDSSDKPDIARRTVPTLVPGTLGTFTVSVSPGKYWLEETQALNGFMLMAERVLIEVDNSGNATLSQGASSFTTVTDHVTSGISNTVEIQDIPRHEFPDSGGAGYTWFTVGALTFLGLSGVLVAKRIVGGMRKQK